MPALRVLALALLAAHARGQSAGDAIFSTPGTFIFSVPADAPSTLSVLCVGAGGSAAFNARQNSGCGGGGGALAYQYSRTCKLRRYC